MKNASNAINQAYGRKSRRSWLKKTALALLFFCALDCAAFLFLPFALLDPTASRSNGIAADAVAVLFHGFDAGGLGVDDETQRRIRHGVSLFREGLAGTIIVAGGNRPRQGRSGAVMMASFVKSLGVPLEKILIESASMDSFGNIRGIDDIARRHGLSKVLVVSSPHHLRRLERIMTPLPPNLVSCPYPLEAATPPIGRGEIWYAFHYNLLSHVLWVVLPRSIYFRLVSLVRFHTAF